MFNEEQSAHIKVLAENPEKQCGCGWFSKQECASYCPNKKSQLPEERVARLVGDHKLKRALSEIDKAISDQYPLKDIEEYKLSNSKRSYTRFHLQILRDKVERLISE